MSESTSSCSQEGDNLPVADTSSNPWSKTPNTGMEHDLHNRGIDHKKNTATAESPWSSEQEDHGNRPLDHDRDQRTAKNCNCGRTTVFGNFWPPAPDQQQQACTPCPRTATVTTTWEVARPAQQGRRSPRSRTGPGESPWSAEQQDRGNRPLHQDREICTTLSKNCNWGISTVFCAVWQTAPDAPRTGMNTVTKNCTCGNRHSILHVWTTPGKLHDLHNRDVDHFVQQQGNPFSPTTLWTMGNGLGTKTGKSARPCPRTATGESPQFSALSDQRHQTQQRRAYHLVQELHLWNRRRIMKTSTTSLPTLRNWSGNELIRQCPCSLHPRAFVAIIANAYPRSVDTSINCSAVCGERATERWGTRSKEILGTARTCTGSTRDETIFWSRSST